ncbi:MAG: hypothetical protein KJO07_19310 [Deltaproteobacteria bacterium]|nr:hypothetical protein [Deltaproteobacteria bacterium]
MELSVFIFATFLSFSSAQGPAPAPTRAPAVEKVADGRAAAQLFFSELRAHLEDGYALTGLSSGDGVVELTFDGAEQVLVIAEVDDRGRVVGTRVLSGPRTRAADHAAIPIADIVELPSLPDDANLSVADDSPELRIRHRGRLLAALPIGAVVIDETMME